MKVLFEKLLKIKSLKYYKTENDKKNELENYFISKTKIQSENINYLGKGKFWLISKGLFLILDKYTFNKLYEIKINKIENIEFDKLNDFKRNKEKIAFVIELDNNDLIFMIRLKQEYIWEFNYELVIYRLKNNNYFLFQKIKEDMTGYKIQYECHG